MTTPEWDDEEIPREEIPLVNLPEEFTTFTYPGSSGSYSSSYATSAYYPGAVTVTSDWIINTSHVVIKPNPSLNTPVIEWDLSDASWRLTINVILGIILSPLLCLISKITKKPMGIR
jgi:hypothetical protein